MRAIFFAAAVVVLALMPVSPVAATPHECTVELTDDLCLELRDTDLPTIAASQTAFGPKLGEVGIVYVEDLNSYAPGWGLDSACDVYTNLFAGPCFESCLVGCPTEYFEPVLGSPIVCLVPYAFTIFHKSEPEGGLANGIIYQPEVC